MSGIVLKSLSDEMLEELLRDIQAEIKQRSYNAGYSQGKFDVKAYENLVGTLPAFSYPSQQRRDEIIEQAKRDVSELMRDAESDQKVCRGNKTMRHFTNRVEFVVNKEKRTVVALVFGKYPSVYNELRERGIAKCAPQDCFNVHIGKAIALRRALGLEVPEEYLNAPQPTEVRVGDKVEFESPLGEIKCRAVSRFGTDRYEFASGTWLPDYYELKIIDDSREGVAE